MAEHVIYDDSLTAEEKILIAGRAGNPIKATGLVDLTWFADEARQGYRYIGLRDARGRRLFWKWKDEFARMSTHQIEGEIVSQSSPL